MSLMLFNLTVQGVSEPAHSQCTLSTSDDQRGRVTGGTGALDATLPPTLLLQSTSSHLPGRPYTVSSSIWVMASVLSQGRSQSRMISSFFCSFSSALTPLFPHLSYRPNAPMSSLCLPLPAPHPPPQHSYSRALPTPETKRPGNHSVAQVISGACLASPPPSNLPILPSSTSLHPSTPVPPPVHSSMTNHMGFH